MVIGGSVLASGAQPPASVTNFFPVVFGVKFYCYIRTDTRTDRVTYGGSTLPKNIYIPLYCYFQSQIGLTLRWS